MKRIILISIVTSLVLCSGKNAIKVRTNYFDIPEKMEDSLNSILQTHKHKTLTEKSLNILFGHMNATVFAGNSPFGSQITSNYFWFVYNALPAFISPFERHNGYYKDERITDHKMQLMAYAIYRVDRSSKNISRLFNFFKPAVKKLLSNKNAYKLRIDEKVNQLIIIHKALEKIPDYKTKLMNFYHQTYTPKGEILLTNQAVRKLYHDSAYGFSCYELGEMISLHLGISRHDAFYGNPDLSFWMRRIKEKNDEVVLHILKEIQSNYLLR